MEQISIIGMFLALVLLSFMVMKGVNIFIAAIASTIVVSLTGGLGLYEALQTHYMGGFANFFGSNFLIFMAGAIMGEVYNKTNGAKAIAKMIIEKMGSNASLIAVPIAIGVLTYGGIMGFVVVFAVYPIAVEIFRQADIPRRFIPAVIIFGSCTFSAVGPGNPQASNVILMNSLGTSLMSGAVIGFICAFVNLFVGLAILTYLVKKAKASGEHFIIRDTDKIDDAAVCPNGLTALVPLVVTLVLINVKVNGVNICPTSFGVFIGAALAYVMMRKYEAEDSNASKIASTGIKNSITTAANTAAVVGFGSVVKSTVGFPILCAAMENIPGPTLLAVAIASTLIAGVCGSASGGMGIAAPILKPIFVDGLGVNPNVLHRMMLIASGGLDTLPHNGFVVTVITGVCGETHKDAYMPVFWLSVVTPLLATAVGIVLFTMFPMWP